jgi:predicted ribosome quality control (RQC) complex YloA/Tae2 family protein
LPPPAPTDPDQGIWRGRRIARRFVSPEGMIVLVGKSASDNDLLSLQLGEPRDFWLHIAADSGSHVVVRNPEGLERCPRETLRFAAALAAGYSKLAKGGQVAVHVASCADISKRRGSPAGEVQLARFSTIRVAPAKGPAAVAD